MSSDPDDTRPGPGDPENQPNQFRKDVTELAQTAADIVDSLGVTRSSGEKFVRRSCRLIRRSRIKSAMVAALAAAAGASMGPMVLDELQGESDERVLQSQTPPQSPVVITIADSEDEPRVAVCDSGSGASNEGVPPEAAAGEAGPDADEGDVRAEVDPSAESAEAEGEAAASKEEETVVSSGPPTEGTALDDEDGAGKQAPDDAASIGAEQEPIAPEEAKEEAEESP